jgi:hypothetical protein
VSERTFQPAALFRDRQVAMHEFVELMLGIDDILLSWKGFEIDIKTCSRPCHHRQ